MVRSADVAKAMLEQDERASRNSNSETFEPFPIDSLPRVMARYARAVAGATGTDPSWAAVAVLIVAAGCIGNRAAAIVKGGWVEPAILWGALVGKSGSIKSVVLRLVSQPVVALFKQERDSFSERMRAYEAEMDRFEVAFAKWKSEQKKGPATDPPVEPEKPTERRVLVSDITVEKLASLLGENPLGLLVVRDELAGLVNSFNRYAGGKGSDLQSWLSMNDGSPLFVDRKADGSTFVERASVSLLGTIQPFTLEQVFGRTEREAGLLARVLLAYPPDQPALWTEAELPDELTTEWCELLACFMSLQPGRDDEGRPKPRLIGLTPEAKRVFVEWHDRHALQITELGNEHLRAHWSKLKGMCIRIALIFACTEAAQGESVSAVSLDSVQRAIAVIEWFKKESTRIYDGFGEGENDHIGQMVIEWIKRQGGSTTVRDLTHGIWSFRGESKRARAILNKFVETGIGHWINAPPGTKGGRPSERFELIVTNSSPSPKPPLGPS